MAAGPPTPGHQGQPAGTATTSAPWRVGGWTSGKLPTLATLKRRYNGYDKIPTDDPDYVDYAIRDAELTGRLAKIALPTDPAYYARERRVATIAARLSMIGLRVDLEEAELRHAAHLVAHADRVVRLVGLGMPAVNKLGKPVADPLQTLEGQEALEKLVGENWPRTPSGRIRVDKETLGGRSATGQLAEILEVQREIADEHDFAGDVSPGDAATGCTPPTGSRPRTVGGPPSDPTSRESASGTVVAAPTGSWCSPSPTRCSSSATSPPSTTGPWPASGDAAYAELLAPAGTCTTRSQRSRRPQR